VIPHSYNEDDPDAAKKLAKAESYEMHAIELIPTMHKPEGLTDEQFEAAKKDRLSQAHSGLGLVYFRRQNWPDSVKELQEATTTAVTPDPTDLFALGYGLQQLNRLSEAADVYDKCAAAPGVLQARCKDSAESARSQITQAK
jgi:uncharacterized protein HemY